jgi:hypothetical protein
MVLIPALHVLAANVTDVTLFVTSGPPGTVVTITGSGFTAASYTVTFGAIQVVPSTSVTFPGGNISAVFAVPTLPRATYNVTVAVTPNVDTVNVPTFTITPEISISKSSGVVGDEIHVSGDGFAPSSVITILFDTTGITTVNSDIYGAFSDTDLTIPEARAGWHTISARDYLGSSPGVVFIVAPKITLSTSTTSVGSTITCSGNGFAASSNISFSLDSTVINIGATTGINGGFSNTALTIPPISGGVHTFKAQDASNNSATANMTISAVITISPDTGPAGTTITITGTGFLANASINITYDGASVIPSSVTVDSKGSFTTSFKAPSGPSGVHTIIASDASYTANAQFTSVIVATVTPTSGAVGTTITASGGGFKAKAPIIISFDGTQVALITTDSIGNFSTTFPASPSSTGTHQIAITDQTNTVQFSFNIVPAFTVEPTSGFVGSDITVKATGFTANRGITIQYDADQKISSNADQNGTLIAIIKAPTSVGGNHLITVSDGTSTLTAIFAMDTVPPPVPPLLVPSSLTKADKIATFSWQEVTDRSGVTYTLQIATDATFSSLILQKQELTTPAYTLTEEETLKSVSKKTPYYWRVKAIDAASNESAWSTPFTFYVGFVLAGWALYVIFGVVAILFGVVGYLLAMLKYRPKPSAEKEVSE